MITGLLVIAWFGLASLGALLISAVIAWADSPERDESAPEHWQDAA